MSSTRLGDAPKLSLWGRLKRIALTDVGAMVRGFNAADLEAMEKTLLEADFGVASTVDLVQGLEDEVRRGRLKTEADLQRDLVARIAKLLEGPPHPEQLAHADPGPTVIVMIGVNGVGKTTTLAKLAHRLQAEGRSVLLCAADTYRAGAIGQLQVWASRLSLLRAGFATWGGAALPSGSS